MVDLQPHAALSADGLVTTPEVLYLPATLYPTNAKAAVDPNGWQGSWDVVQGRPRQLGLTPRGRLTSETGVKRDPVEVASGLLQVVSDPLAAQTVRGALTITLAVGASDLAFDAVFAVHAWVTQGDSAVPRGTVLANGLAALDDEWPLTDAARTLSLPMTPLVVQRGDRLVIELGFLSVGGPGSGTLWYGGTGPDLTVDQAPTAGVGTIAVGGALPVVDDELTPSEEYQTLTTDAIVSGGTIVTLRGDGVMQTIASLILAGDALIGFTQIQELLGNAQLFGTDDVSLDGDGLLRALSSLFLRGDALVPATIQQILPGDALLRVTRTRALLADLMLVSERWRQLGTDALVVSPLVIKGRRTISRRGGATAAARPRFVTQIQICQRLAGTPRQSVEGIVAINRIAAPATNRRLALEDLRIDGEPLTELVAGETIHYQLFAPDETLVGEGDPVYGLVRIDRPETIFARNIFGWYADVLLPEQVGIYRVAWDLNV